MQSTSFKALRQRKCRSCGERYRPRNTLQRACSVRCAIALGRDDEKRKQRRENAQARAKLETRRDLLKKAQKAFNSWVKKRDAALPCISCGRHHTGQWHAGHYLSTAARPELRFEPLNCWKQCAPCNTHLSGNLVLYRAELVRRIGVEKVEWLEGPHAPKKWTVDDLRELQRNYRVLASLPRR